MHSFNRISLLAVLTTMSLALAGPAALAKEESPSVPMISGGVGDEEFDAIQNEKGRFNTRVLFTEIGGAYLSDVNVTISTAKGVVVATTVTQGPILLVKLKPGSYSIKASVSGVTKEQKLNVGSKGVSNAHVILPLRDNID